MTLTLGFSPCPNDTFIFDALVNSAIDTEGLQFDVRLEDVETLNRWAAEGKLDVTKLSFPALFQNTMQYVALLSGAALGNGVGPLLIAKRALNMNQVEQYRIAIPGVNTTANFLLSYAFPEAANRVPGLFSEIESAVLNEAVDLGVIIHENRFTYEQKGLVKICDLGEVWEQRQGAAIPLGCIAARRTLPQDIVLKTESLIRKSLTHAFGQYPALSPYVRRHAQEMDEAVMRQHIELYVNNYTMDLGPQGKAAIEKLFAVYRQQNNLSVNSTPDLFLQNTME
jgi:1,4-dihydroxy-6-naphthoate synthase